LITPIFKLACALALPTAANATAHTLANTIREPSVRAPWTLR
jgi:hypothetical protein